MVGVDLQVGNRLRGQSHQEGLLSLLEGVLLSLHVGVLDGDALAVDDHRALRLTPLLGAEPRRDQEGDGEKPDTAMSSRSSASRSVVG